MVCEAKEAVGFYRPWQPQETPFYKLVKRFYPEFESVVDLAHRRTGLQLPLFVSTLHVHSVFNCSR